MWELRDWQASVCDAWDECDAWDNDFKKFSSAEHHGIFQLSSPCEALCIQLAISYREAPWYLPAIFPERSSQSKLQVKLVPRVPRVAHVPLCYLQVAKRSPIPNPISLAIFKRRAPSHSPCYLLARNTIPFPLLSSSAERYAICQLSPCAEHSGGALRRLELSGAAGWVGWCCTGRPEIGTAFRRIRPPIAQQSRADRPLTGAANECRLKGGTRKHHPHPSPCGAKKVVKPVPRKQINVIKCEPIGYIAPRSDEEGASVFRIARTS